MNLVVKEIKKSVEDIHQLKKIKLESDILVKIDIHLYHIQYINMRN